MREGGWWEGRPFLRSPTAAPRMKIGRPMASFYDVLAVLQPPYGEHGVGRGIFSFLSTREARPLRLVSRVLCADVQNARWYDRDTVIAGDLRRWRVCFTNARCANVSERRDLTDADLVHLVAWRR